MDNLLNNDNGMTVPLMNPVSWAQKTKHVFIRTIIKTRREQ